MAEGPTSATSTIIPNGFMKDHPVSYLTSLLLHSEMLQIVTSHYQNSSVQYDTYDQTFSF